MTIHDLKVKPTYFDALFSGEKPFEVRRDDRGFQKGDLLKLREWDHERSPIEEYKYTGREITRTISYVLTGGQFGIAPGYVVLGLSTKSYYYTLRRGRSNKSNAASSATDGEAVPKDGARLQLAPSEDDSRRVAAEWGDGPLDADGDTTRLSRLEVDGANPSLGREVAQQESASRSDAPTFSAPVDTKRQ